MEPKEESSQATSGEDLRPGHDKLLSDLSSLLYNAQTHKYHDLKSDVAAPKAELVQHLSATIERVKQGIYDD